MVQVKQESLERILAQVRAQDSILKELTVYKCKSCKDTGWIETIPWTYRRCSCITKSHMEKLWRDFGVNPNKVKKLREFMPYDPLTVKVKEKSLEYVKNFMVIKDEENNWFGLFGQPGSGKSHIILAIGAALLAMDFSVVYMPYTESMKVAKSYANDGYEYTKFMKKYINCDVLIIDDLFKDKVSNGELISTLKEADIRHIYPILNTRYYNNMPTVVSSECTLENLVDLDEALGGRILEKCGTKIFFKGEGYDYRLKSFCKD